MVSRPLIFSILVTILVGIFVNKISLGYFSAEEGDKALGRLSLYRSSVVDEVERYAHLTHILARDPYVMSAAAGGDTTALNQRLQGFSDRAGLDAIYLMDQSGVTIAASNHATASSFVGQTYAFRPYFKDAIAGGQGRFYAIGATTGLPGYFIADGVRGPEQSMLGVIAIKKSFDALEESWRNAGEQVVLANADGVVLLASLSEWRYRTLSPLTESKRHEITEARQFPGEPMEPLDWHPRAGSRATIAGDERLHLIADDLPNDWQLHYFAADDRAITQSWLATAGVVLVAGSLLIVFQVQRARRISRRLQRSQREEAQLRETNAMLAVEIGERKTAEQRLRRAQDELERASRLAALGQLSASVTHELGQPIAAMRNHLAAAELRGAPEPLSANIGGLVDRMEGITRQLKFFANPHAEAFEVFDLRSAMTAALELLTPNIEETGTEVVYSPPSKAILVRGSRLRIEQVMTNVLRNAVDAVEESETPMVWVELGGSEDAAWFEVRDNGHGLGPQGLQELQEPFVTTRESGRGMGLGLSISAGIIKDHKGKMTAQNGKDGGAVFRVTIPVAPDAEDKSDE
ncbi:ATP-binding protein [uncultured Shimia sp.]|uniref:sensor histidine kinase n=1 Tax=uncultured Shimia sp. TaxID=573152 RepID=UPI002623B76D|nr:ATP-binding protein [uncultured Shimia sp.]